MASPAPKDLPTAVAQSDVPTIQRMLEEGCDINQMSKDGMTPLALAAFWGAADIAKVLLKHGADVNSQNRGTKWTPLHCAAFQGHGAIILWLMEYKPNLDMRDMRGRTAVDFASAHDGIWPFFAAAGCKRTPKADLIKMDIMAETYNEGSGDRSQGYEIDTGAMDRSRDPNMDVAAITGDVLADSEDKDDALVGRAGLNIYQ